MSRTYDSQVITDNDDVQITLNGVSLTDLVGTELKWMAANDEVWCRFQGPSIPRGSKIVSAVIKLTGKSAGGNITLNIDLEAAGDSAQPTGADGPGTRSWGTVAANQWVLPAWSDLSINTSPDLADIVQELVRRSDWTGDINAQGDFMFRLKPASAGSKGSQRTAYAFDHNNNALAPEVVIVYTPPPHDQARIVG